MGSSADADVQKGAMVVKALYAMIALSTVVRLEIIAVLIQPQHAALGTMILLFCAFLLFTQTVGNRGFQQSE